MTSKLDKIKIKFQTIADMGDKQVEAVALAMLEFIELLDKKEIGFTNEKAK